MTEGAVRHINSFLGSLRYFGAFIYYVIESIGHDAITNPHVDIVFFVLAVSVVVSIFSIYIYNCINRNNILYFLVVDFSILITVVNVWFTNILTFPECISITAIGLCFCFVSLMLYFNSKKFYQYVISSIFLICAIAVYQQFVSVFIIYAVLIVGIKMINDQHDTMEQNLKKYAKLLVFVAISSVVYYVLGKIIISCIGLEPNERISLTVSTVLENINFFTKYHLSYLKGRGMVNSGVLALYYFIVALLWLVSLVTYTKKTKNVGKAILLFVSYVVAYSSAYLPGLVSTSKGTRTMCALFSVFALFSLGALTMLDKKMLKSVLCGIIVLVFVMNIYQTLDMASEQIAVNTKEIDYVNTIVYEIHKYEKDSEKTVQKIGVCYDENADMNCETLYTGYSVEALLRLQLNRNVEFVDTPDTVYKDNFAGKDWQFYDSDEQLIFIDDTLYLCVY